MGVAATIAPREAGNLMSMPAETACEVTWCLVGCGDTSESSRRVPIVQIPFRVGRLPETHCCISDPTISKNHSEFFEDGGRLMLRDLRSTNGTFVNGERIIRDYPVQEGDLIQFANIVFKLGRERTSGAMRQTLEQEPGEWPLALLQFERMLQDRLGDAALPADRHAARAARRGL